MARGARHRLRDRRRAEGRREERPADGRRRDGAAWRTSASTAGTRRRGTSAAAERRERFDYLYSEEELREWVEPLRELAGQSEEAYAFFNNNNQTSGVAQAPAGAELLRRLLQEHDVPVGMRILAVTHGPMVRPELFGDVAREDGHELVEWEIARRGRPPENGFDAVMVFGGEMNVGEERAHPWLHDEYDLLRRWVEAGTPLLGVCLGAQTLAHAHGGRVAQAEERHAGFYETRLTEDGASDAVLGVLPPRFEALNANGYEFEVPAGGVALADGPVPQAFRLGDSAWGVQFHPEVRRDQVLAWWAGRDALPKPLDQLTVEVDAGIGLWQELGRALCRAFLRAAER